MKVNSGILKIKFENRIFEYSNYWSFQKKEISKRGIYNNDNKDDMKMNKSEWWKFFSLKVKFGNPVLKS